MPLTAPQDVLASSDGQLWCLREVLGASSLLVFLYLKVRKGSGRISLVFQAPLAGAHSCYPQATISNQACRGH